MRANHIAFVFVAASAALAQTGAGQSDVVLRFVNTATPQGRQEIGNAVRGVAQVPVAMVNNSAGTLTVQGTAPQIALAQWLFKETDQPAAAASHVYTVPGGGDDVTRIFYPTNPRNPQAMQEMVNIIRSISELQKVMVCNGPKAIAARGTSAQIEAAAWIVNDLDQPSGPGVHRYQMPDSYGNTAMRAIHLAHASVPQVMQEIVNSVRSIADLQRVVPYTSAQTIVMRGSPSMIAVGEWLVSQLDLAAAQPGDHQMVAPGTNGDIARVFYLQHSASSQALQEVVNTVRATTKMQRVVSYQALQAVALRGSPAQVAQSAQLVTELDK